MLIYIPQSGMSLPEVVKDAKRIAKALDETTGYGYIEVHFQDIIFGINEKCDEFVTLQEIFDEIKYKYQKQGGNVIPMIESHDYWMENIQHANNKD